MSAPPLSLIVATRGRATPFQALFESLAAQTFRQFEVVVVDQNPDDRVGEPAQEGWPFSIAHLRTPTEKGASRARNAGLAVARGTIVLFPDDDCWYAPTFLEHALERMLELDADVLSGRAADEATGRDINGRFEKAVTRIDRDNVFTTGIEWVVFFKRPVIDAVGGYDVDIGVGATTPWQSCEAQDIILRLLERGHVCIFDPGVFGHHAELDINDPVLLRKGRAYARGFGYVLRLHRYSARTAAVAVTRPLARMALCLVRGKMDNALYYWIVAMGRIEGWRMKVGTNLAPRSHSCAQVGVSSPRVRQPAPFGPRP